MLLTCQAGFEGLLARELTELHGATVAEQGPGWARLDQSKIENPKSKIPDLTFAHLALLAPVEIRGDAVNALAARVAELFLGSLRGERVEAAWPNVWLGPHELVGLGRRLGAVEAAFGEQLKKKLSRVAKLATPDLPRGAGPVRGLFVFFVDFGRAFVAREAIVNGQRRMADDDLAPSRSYLKVEEAYVVLGREPLPGETVCDLGAAPGGWSFSAAKRGARVVAIDNGPLKGGALDHPQIEHRTDDAFRFTPDAASGSDASGSGTASGSAAPFDWMFCDLLEEPHHVMKNLIEPWLARGWCRRFVFNLKFGHVDPIELLRELRDPGSPLSRHAPHAIIRHLYHDREEFTVVGELQNP